ncbi:MAG: oxygenase MpaB family protein [Chitinophagales bacterium]
MPQRFVYHQRVKKSIWPTLFKLLGRTLFDAPNVIPDKKRIDTFERYLMEGDALADAAARDLFLSDRKHLHSFRIMNKVLDQGISADDDIPDSFRKLMFEVNQDPDWLDRKKVEQGAEICRRLGGHAMAVLGDLALLGGYANSDISKPLVFTGALKGDSTFDRISETSQFWYDVTRRGALEKGAKGYKSAIRVRMMHAMVRQRLLMHPKWDSEKWGWPINEADSLATNVGFSMAMVYGCTWLGYYLPNKDIEAVLHLWRYIGYLMGDDTDWLPKTTEEGLQCLLLLHLSNENIPDEESKVLARDYLNSFKPKSNHSDWKQYLNDYYFFMKHKAYAELLIPPDLYSKLDLPSSNFTWMLVPMIETPAIFIKDRLRALIPDLHKRIEREGAREQEDVIKTRMGEKQASYIPKEKMEH